MDNESIWITSTSTRSTLRNEAGKVLDFDRLLTLTVCQKNQFIWFLIHFCRNALLVANLVARSLHSALWFTI
jgi:hypothetical protein